MSDSANVFTDLDHFSTRLGTLLSSSAAGQAPKIASKLRAEKQLKVAIESLIKILEGLAQATENLKKPIEKAVEVAAGCEAIADSLDAFGDGESLGKVAKLCGQSDGVVQPILDKIVLIRGPLKAALSILGSLPTPSELIELSRNLTDLADDLKALQGKIENPIASTSIPTASTTGGKQT
ncbi:MAG: hypothetical protein JNK99_10295 [Candidatus Accumulibacter sp.]|uniref:hypothetical protein n=1 Tax=Accumulibacter sp. TaxID=2053492 RepID=UPI001A62FA0C|nr:hypothetical protein [Accumulibacter sp.]MBL8395121.1 hypothetical protein [Accumulibacter sp.]